VVRAAEAFGTLWALLASCIDGLVDAAATCRDNGGTGALRVAAWGISRAGATGIAKSQTVRIAFVNMPPMNVFVE
jgi:hypothetical protein